MSSKFGRRASIAALKSVANKRSTGPAGGLADSSSAGAPNNSSIPFTAKLSFLDSSIREYDIFRDSPIRDLLIAVQEELKIEDLAAFAVFLLVTEIDSADTNEVFSPSTTTPSTTTSQCRRLSDSDIVFEVLKANVAATKEVKLLFKTCEYEPYSAFDMKVFQYGQPIKSLTIELQLLYMEALVMIFSGRYFLSEDEALQVGAMLLQIEHGDFNSRYHNDEFFKSSLLRKFPDPVRKEFNNLIMFQTTATKKMVDRYILRAKICYSRLSSSSLAGARIKLLDYLKVFSPFFGSRQVSAKIKGINERSFVEGLGMTTLAIGISSFHIVASNGLIMKQPFIRIMKWEIVGPNDFKYWILQDTEHSPKSFLSVEFREGIVGSGKCDEVHLEVDDPQELALFLRNCYNRGVTCDMREGGDHTSISQQPASTLSSIFTSAETLTDEGNELNNVNPQQLTSDVCFESRWDELETSGILKSLSMVPTSQDCLMKIEHNIQSFFDSCTDQLNPDDEMRAADILDVLPDDGGEASSKKNSNKSFKGLRRASRILFSNMTSKVERTESKRLVLKQSSSYGGISYNLMSGEDILFEIEDKIDWIVNNVKHFRAQHILSGSICITNYRIILTAQWSDENSSPLKQVPPAFREVSIPLATIHKLGTSAAHKESIYVYCRDFRVVRIGINDIESYKEKQSEMLQILNDIIFPLANSSSNKETARMIKVRSKLFAYYYSSMMPLNDVAWEFSDLEKEYARLKLAGSDYWQVYDNSDYALSDTYPSHIVLPRNIDNDQILAAAGFRSKGRLPAATYRHFNGAILCRSSQPLIGLTQKKCNEDELLLNLFRSKGRAIQGSDDKLYILDARSKVAAALNMASGRGTEDISVYGNAELIFGNIENIHVMRSSIESLSEHLSISTSPFVDVKELIQSTEVNNTIFYTNLDECGWLKHIRMVLLSGVCVAEKLHVEGNSVLVHCSDGWDRTAQICCIAQLLLDPYYRTMDGFAVLVEKDWCAFGHKFQDRYGTGQDTATLPDEKSPVFIQFLDAVYQIIVQFPNCFEFTEELLLFVANHIFSGLFGNFLGNSDKERKTQYEVVSATKSIWAYVLQNKARFANPTYTNFVHPIWPSTAMHRTKVWDRFWLRWDLSAHPRGFDSSSHGWDDDWGNKCHL